MNETDISIEVEDMFESNHWLNDSEKEPMTFSVVDVTDEKVTFDVHFEGRATTVIYDRTVIIGRIKYGSWSRIEQ